MTKVPRSSVEDFVRTVTEEARLYLNELKTENDSLRAAVARLETERGTDRQASTLHQELEAVRRAVADREGDLTRANDRIRKLQDQLVAYEHKEVVFHEQLAVLERKQHQAGGRHSDLERRLTHVSALYAASYRIHESLDRKAVLAAVCEVVANTLGCEVFGVFERVAELDRMALIGSMGIDEARFASVQLAADPVSIAIEQGELFVGEGPRAGGELRWDQALVCVPLKLPDQRVIGGIVIFELLPQKPVLEAGDLEVLELLSNQAALALLWSRAAEDLGRSAAQGALS